MLPDTVAATRGEPLFPIVRAWPDSPRRLVVTLEDGRRVWADDNGPPADAFRATPAFLAKTTDTDPTVRAALRHRARELYGRRPVGETDEDVPPGYGDLAWAPTTDAVPNLEGVLRARMRRAPKSSSTRAARELGWLFSGWQPDATV